MPALVSAVITTRNRLALLKEAVKSVLEQDYAPLECIVVDDASTDGTEEYCRALPGIVYLRIEARDSKGGNYARNLGIKAARGDYIAFCDDDDTWAKDKTRKQAALLDNRPEVGVVYCGCVRKTIPADKQNGSVALPRRKNRGKLGARSLYTIVGTTTTMMMRRGPLFEAGLFDERLKFWQETELMMRLAQITQVDFVNEPLITLRIDNTEKTRLSNKYWEWRDAVRYIMEKHKELYRQLSSFEKGMQKIVFYADAAARSLTAGERGEYRKNRRRLLFFKLLLLPYRCYERFLNF